MSQAVIGSAQINYGRQRVFRPRWRGSRISLIVSIGVLLGLTVAPPSVRAATQIGTTTYFGRVVVGYSTQGGGIEMCDNGYAPVTIESASITGADPSDFISSNIGACDNQTLNQNDACYSPGNDCKIPLVFQPTTYGSRTANLSVIGDSLNYIEPLQGEGGIILVNGQPTDADQFPIAASGPLGIDEATDPIAFSATGVGSSQTVTWKTTLNYQTSGGVPQPKGFTVSSSFHTTGTAPSSSAFTSEGGLLKVFATVGTFTDQITNDEVVGVTPPTGIPYSTITSQLESLYSSVSYILYKGNKVSFSPVTPELMAQVATVESSERQFADKGLYYSDSSWPLESPKETVKRRTIPAGAHIGLMQLPTTMADAWDWLQNAHDGVLLPNDYSFQDKLGTGYWLSVKLGGALHLALSSCQLEEMALELNGPSAGRVYSMQYYTTEPENGSPQWIINTKNNCGVCYVIKVRDQVPLSGGSTSSCPATPSIPADPPTDLVDSLNCSSCPI